MAKNEAPEAPAAMKKGRHTPMHGRSDEKATSQKKALPKGYGNTTMTKGGRKGRG